MRVQLWGHCGQQHQSLLCPDAASQGVLMTTDPEDILHTLSHTLSHILTHSHILMHSPGRQQLASLADQAPGSWHLLLTRKMCWE